MCVVPRQQRSGERSEACKKQSHEVVSYNGFSQLLFIAFIRLMC